MKKVPCVFQRDFGGEGEPLAKPEVTPGCEWVLAGEGVATRKRDGTACAVIGGVLHLRYDAKRGKQPPPDALPCQEPDAVTGHWPHWLPVGERPEGKWHREAWAALPAPLPDGTYELCGPKVGANAERLETHRFYRHGAEALPDAPRDYQDLRGYLERSTMEGIVFHHPDGRMAKLRRVDFGFAWGAKPGLGRGRPPKR